MINSDPYLTSSMVTQLNQVGGSVKALKRKLWLELSESDRKDYASLTHAFNNVWKDQVDGKYGTIATDPFTSSLYSDALKRCFATFNVSSSFVLCFQDEFLNEEIIFNHVNDPRGAYLGGYYLIALMKSSHLSERIIEAIFREGDYWVSQQALELTPDALVTPRVVKGWMSQALGKKESHLPAELLFAMECVRRAHPEYDDFPDDWVLKIFCGE